MNRRRENLLLLALATLSLLTNNGVAALSQKYCSSENTASNSPEQSIYQSNGHCSTVCSKYAFAVVQGQNCWCSNYIPSDQQSTSSCNEKCPGYPYEYCGSSSAGLYGYVALGNTASGTAGAASSSSETTAGTSTSSQVKSAAPSFFTSAETATVVSSQTVVNSVTVQTTVTADASTSDATASSTTLSTSTTKSSTSWTPTPVVTTIISSGSVVTITSTPTVAPMQTSKSGGGISKGAVAGVVVAAFAGLAILGFGIFFFLRRRSKEEQLVDSAGMVATPSRMGSQMSRNGLLGNPFGRANSLSHTQHGSSDGGISPISPVAERRSSKPLVFDQRLNPDLYLHEDSSRVSVSTIDDHRDYNRKLNVRNPDPDDRD